MRGVAIVTRGRGVVRRGGFVMLATEKRRVTRKIQICGDAANGAVLPSSCEGLGGPRGYAYRCIGLPRFPEHDSQAACVGGIVDWAANLRSPRRLCPQEWIPTCDPSKLQGAQI